MRWMDLVRKSAEYARKSIEEIRSALRQPGPTSPSYEPAYSRYRKQSPSPPKRAHFKSTGANGHCNWFHRHTHHKTFHTHRRGHSRFAGRSGAQSRFCGKKWSRYVLVLLKRAIIMRTSPVFSLKTPGVSRIITWGPNRALSVFASSFNAYSKSSPSCHHNVGSKTVGSKIAELHLLSPFASAQDSSARDSSKKPSIPNSNNSPFQMLKTIYFRATAKPMQATLSLLPAYLSQKQEIERKRNETEPFLSADEFLCAALDFDISPHFALPEVGELTEQMVAEISDAFDAHRSKLALIMSEFKRVSELGELPVSVEQNGTVLRVHFPNCDPERLHILCNEKNIVFGQIVEIHNPVRGESAQSDIYSESSESVISVPSTNCSIDTGLDETWSQILDAVPELTETASTEESGTPSLLTYDIA